MTNQTEERVRYKEPKNHTEKCIDCKRRFKMLASDGRCYCCFVNKHGTVPKEWNPTGKYNG